MTPMANFNGSRELPIFLQRIDSPESVVILNASINPKFKQWAHFAVVSSKEGVYQGDVFGGFYRVDYHNSVPFYCGLGHIISCNPH